MRRVTLLLFAILFTLLAVMFVTNKADAATISKSDYKHLKGLWRTWGGGINGPRYYVRFTRSKAKIYYGQNKASNLRLDYIRKILSVDRDEDGKVWYKIGPKKNPFYYVWMKEDPFQLHHYWRENGELYYSGTASLERIFKKPARVRGVKVKKTSKRNTRVKWKKAKNATKYQVFLTDVYDSGWLLLGKTKKTYYDLKDNVLRNVRFKVKVRAVNPKKKGKFSKAKAFVCKGGATSDEFFGE